MHDSAREAARVFFREYRVRADARVLELGSMSVDGGLRELFPDHARWVGVDIQNGPGVDVVLQDPYTLPFDDGSFDVAVASSVLEHNEMFWLSFLEMVRVVRPGGLIYICSPSNGHIHRYPVDCFRFYPDAGAALAKWAERCGLSVAVLESLVLRKESSEWSDWCVVFSVGSHSSPPTVAGRLTEVLAPFALGASITTAELPHTQATEDQLDLHRATAEIEVTRSRLARVRRWSPKHWSRSTTEKFVNRSQARGFMDHDSRGT